MARRDLEEDDDEDVSMEVAKLLAKTVRSKTAVLHHDKKHCYPGRKKQRDGDMVAVSWVLLLGPVGHGLYH